MATLRAAAYILNVALLVISLFVFLREADKPDDFVLLFILTAAPTISILALALNPLKGRKED